MLCTDTPAATPGPLENFRTNINDLILYYLYRHSQLTFLVQYWMRCTGASESTASALIHISNTSVCTMATSPVLLGAMSPSGPTFFQLVPQLILQHWRVPWPIGCMDKIQTKQLPFMEGGTLWSQVHVEWQYHNSMPQHAAYLQPRNPWQCLHPLQQLLLRITLLWLWPVCLLSCSSSWLLDSLDTY